MIMRIDRYLSDSSSIIIWENNIGRNQLISTPNYKDQASPLRWDQNRIVLT